MAKKGFVISWFYPPGNSSEGLVSYKLLKNSKYKYDVFTRETSEYDMWDRDVVEDKLVAKNVTIIKSATDDRKKWIEEAVNYFMEHRDEYSFIMSRIMPAEAHVAAMEIKKRCPEIKWLASFGDPLVRTPYIFHEKKSSNPYRFRNMVRRENLSIKRWPRIAISPTRNMNKMVWKKWWRGQMIDVEYYDKINTDVFKNADKLLFNNFQQFEHAFDGEMSSYKNKGIVVPHSFDVDLYPKIKHNKNKKINFLYVGHLDDLRNARAVLKAINLLRIHDSDLSKRVSFKFYGHMSDSDKCYIVDHHIADVVEINGNIGYIKSLEEIERSDWTILIDANFNDTMDEYLFFPAKLVDYIGAKKKILAITQLKGATADVLRKTGGAKIVTHSADDIALYLAKIIYKGFEPVAYNEKALNEYNAKLVAKTYDDMVRKLLND